MRPWREVVTTPPFEENCYLLGDLDAGEAVVIDPGGRAGAIAGLLTSHNLVLKAILGTHAHVDHVAGVAELRAMTSAPFLVHAEARRWMPTIPEQAQMFGLPAVAAPSVDGLLTAGQVVAVGGMGVVVRETPGHAPGHVTLVRGPIEGDGGEPGVAFCGDVIFCGAIGRFDLPGGDYPTLMASIEREILSLPADTILCSGHGPDTTVGWERAHNPFVREWIDQRAANGARW